MNLSEAIKLYLKNNKITQVELSKRLGTSRQYISNSLKNWESETKPNIKTLKKWAQALGVDYKNFLDFL